MKIKSGSSSYILGSGQETEQSSLNKRQKNFISIELSDLDALPHELGHAVDFWFGMSQPLTSQLILSNGKTFKDILVDEFLAQHNKAYEEIMEQLKSILDSRIGKGAFDTIFGNIKNLRKLHYRGYDPESKTEKEKRRNIQKELYEKGFVEAYYELYTNNLFSQINEDYSIVLDALSSVYDLSFLGLVCHGLDYYEYTVGSRTTQEFFANIFQAKVTSKQAQIDNTAKYFPKSVEAFEELFNIIFDHIEQNKRFTDVKTRKGEIND